MITLKAQLKHLTLSPLNFIYISPIPSLSLYNSIIIETYYDFDIQNKAYNYITCETRI